MRSARAERALVLIVLVANASACRPTLDDEVSRVDGPRVLAVTAEPPEAKPGEVVALRALYTDGSASSSASALTYSFCLARRGLAEPTAIADACIEDEPGARSPLGVGAVASGALPGDACRLFGPERPIGKPGEPAGRPVDPDGTGGYYQPGILTTPAGERAIFEVRVRCGLAGATQAVVADLERRYRPNANPVVEGLFIVRADGATELVPEGGTVAMRPSELVTVRAAGPACTGDAPCGGAESYVAYEPLARIVEQRRESIRASWLAAGGHFREPRTGRGESDLADDTETTFSAPAEARELPAWVVLRDARGGVGWRSFRVRVAP